MISKTRLFVGSLPYHFSESELLKLFVTEGRVVDVRIIKNRWGKSRGMGFVQFDDPLAAVNAKEKYHNFLVEDRTIIVDFAKEDPLNTPEGKARFHQAKRFKAQKVDAKNHMRKSVFESRAFGSRVGAKFAKRNKKK